MLWVDVTVKAATIGLLLVAIAFPDVPQFHEKAFAARAVAYPVALAVVPTAWWLFGRARLAYPFAVDILLGLPFLIDMAGNAANLYDAVWWWDDVNHLVNWALHTAAIGVLLRGTGLAPWGRFGVAVAWAATTAIVWELLEYATFVTNSPEAATAYRDTLGDLALGLLGGTIAAAAVAWWPERDRKTSRAALLPLDS